MTNSAAPSAANLYLLVGYDGSAPATRALDAAVRLLDGRTGSIDVFYVAHPTTGELMSPDALAELQTSFAVIAKELHAQAGEQLRDQDVRWGFEHTLGDVADMLIKAAEQLQQAHPGDNVVIVVGSSSHALHRMVGSVPVSLARRAPVPVVIVP
jgi:nucleotide-binding universal stress UspA family protein